MRIPGADKAVENLLNWSSRDEWVLLFDEVLSNHLSEISSRFGLMESDIEEELGESFIMVYGWILEDFFTTADEDGKTVIDDYLKRRGWREKVPAKRYLEALGDSCISLYEVVDVEPGRSVTVRDIILGGPAVKISEESGSKTMVQWDRIAARVVTVNKKPFFTGGLLPFDHEAAEQVLYVIDGAAKDMRRDVRQAAKKAGEKVNFKFDEYKALVLNSDAYLFTTIWLKSTLEKLSAPMPELHNIDGDKIEFTDVSFPIQGEESAMATAIDDLEAFERDAPGESRWIWYADDVGEKKSPTEEGLTIMTSEASGTAISGYLEIVGERLVLSANSRARATRGRKLLQIGLGKLVGQPLTSLQTLEKARDEADPGSSGAREVPPEIAEELMRQFYDDHYGQALDDPLPILDDKTPRQMVRSKKGREKVVAWLKMLENSESHRAARGEEKPYDFLWMWQELKIEDQR